MIELKSAAGSTVPVLLMSVSGGAHYRQRAKPTARGYTISKICVALCLDRVARQLRHVVSVLVEIPTNWVSGGGGLVPRSGTMTGFDGDMSPSATRWSTKNRWKDCMS